MSTRKSRTRLPVRRRTNASMRSFTVKGDLSNEAAVIMVSRLTSGEHGNGVPIRDVPGPGQTGNGELDFGRTTGNPGHGEKGQPGFGAPEGMGLGARTTGVVRQLRR